MCFVSLLLSASLATDVATIADLIKLFHTTKTTVDDDINLQNDLVFSQGSLSYPLGADSLGCHVTFSGFLQGNGHSIKGLEMDNSNQGKYNHAGLFCNMKNARIENLTIDSSCSFKGNWSGSLSVTATGSVYLKNVTNNADIHGVLIAGGLIALMKELDEEMVSLTFEGSVNNGKVDIEDIAGLDDTEGAGGFIGVVMNNAHLKFSHCTNTGNITGLDAGGFSGALLTNKSITVSGCVNDGWISSTTGYFGGFFGMVINLETSMIITNSTNNGGINGTGYNGGFVGNCQSIITITFSTNTGSFNGVGVFGGLFGVVALSDIQTSFGTIYMGITISNCNNSGNMTLDQEEEPIIGGFIGGVVFSESTQGMLTITNCKEIGFIDGSSKGGDIGGIIGFVTFYSDDDDDYNNENEEWSDNSYHNQITINSTVDIHLEFNCTECIIGGVIGFISSETIMQKNSVSITVTGNQNMTLNCGTCSVGGIIGKVNQTVQALVKITDSFINGILNVTCFNMGQSAVGGFVGSASNNNKLELSISDSTSDCILSTKGIDKVGGIIGTISNSKNVIEGATLNMKKVRTNGNITSFNSSIIGGIVGFIFNIETIKITECSNHGEIRVGNQLQSNSVAGGLIGSFTDTMNVIISPMITLEGNVNHGIINVTNSSTMSVGGIIGSIHDSFNAKMSVIKSFNNGKMIYAKTKSNHIGGLIGNITNNGDLKIDIKHCSNHAIIKSDSDDGCYDGGLIGPMIGNAKYNLDIYNCTNTGEIKTSGKDNDVGGFLGTVERNQNGNITLENSINIGNVSVNKSTGISYLGGIIGSVKQNPLMDLKIKTSFNHGNVESCVTCETSNSGFIGFVDLMNDGTKFHLTIINSLNNGIIKTIIGKETMSCGFFCVSKESKLHSSIVLQVNNSINKGSIDGDTSYGIASKATSVYNVVSLGFVNGTESNSFFEVWKTVYNYTYALNTSCSKITGKHSIFYNISGQYIINDKQLYKELNKQAMNEQYEMMWDQKLDLTKGINISVGKPVSQDYVVAMNTTIGQFREVFDSLGKYHNYWIVNTSTEQEIDNSTRIKNKTILALCHKISFKGVFEMTVYVENGMNLSFSIPHLPEEYLEPHYKFYSVEGVFEHTNTVTKDMNFTVRIFCDDMKKDTCKNYSACIWIGGSCEEKGWVIVVIVICSIAALACLGAAAFVIITKFFISKPYDPIIVDLLETIKIPINGKETELQLIEEIGRGRFGSVHHAQAKDTGLQYAVKIIPTTSVQESEQVVEEVEVMEKLCNEYVVAIYGLVCAKASSAIAMEYFPLGSLQKILNEERLQPNALIPMLLDIAKAMAYIHAQNIIHRDLKPGNVLVCSLDPHKHPMAKFVSFSSLSEKNSVVKKDHKTNHTLSTYRISDFGTARKVKMIEASMTMTSGVGTPFYMAPEIISNVKHYTGAVDVYSFGIMAAQVIVGKLIFDIDEYNADCCLFFYHIMLIICVF